MNLAVKIFIKSLTTNCQSSRWIQTSLLMVSRFKNTIKAECQWYLIFGFSVIKKISIILISLFCVLTSSSVIATDYYWEIFNINPTIKSSTPSIACAEYATTQGGTFGWLVENSGTGTSVIDCYYKRSDGLYNSVGVYRNGSTCPPNTFEDVATGLCLAGCPAGKLNASCVANKTQGQSCKPNQPSVYTSYPIHTSTGNKYWSDTDYHAVGVSGLNFSRHYNSQNTAVLSTLGTAWRHQYDSSITTGLIIKQVSAVLVARANGAAYSFSVRGTVFTSQDADITDTLVGLTDASGNITGYRYTVASDKSIETYSATGKLLTIQDRTGLVQALTYSDSSTPTTIAPSTGLLIRVTDSFGRQLNFTYDGSNRIATMVDPANGQYKYVYDATNNLGSVTYPDLKTKTYLYNEAAYTGGTSLPNALTGIVDENGIRYASYWYDAQGRAYAEQHAGGVDQYQIGYSTDGSTSSITDPLGTTRITNFTNILGVIKVTGQSQPGGSGCGASSSAVTYDANGNVASRTDFIGNITTYQYDLSRNLETSRTEASGSGFARTITTQWHPTYRLPVAIAEPLRKTTFNYDNAGNLLLKSVQATSDANGSQGLSAPTVGTPRNWGYTYNQVGQILTATGPRTDVADVTTYAYDDATGNLLTITNAAGQVTTLSNYDANGRVGAITDPNGLTTTMTYYPRGWLKSKVVSSANGGGSQSTTYHYDGVGQLTSVDLPDNSTVTYTYDPAHRLTDIADSFNNRIHYTLDAMGNRINEQVTDPNGTLARQTTRIYDALNRLQQVTGATQ